MAPGLTEPQSRLTTVYAGWLHEFLNEVLFSSLRDARDQIRFWQHDYNHHRPHSGLGNIPPVEFAKKNRLEMRAA